MFSFQNDYFENAKRLFSFQNDHFENDHFRLFFFKRSKTIVPFSDFFSSLKKRNDLKNKRIFLNTNYTKNRKNMAIISKPVNRKFVNKAFVY